ncbi:glycosyltransferase family 2 protein [Pedobacter immunditicola]|uniref:glycosyltransferase family 2 protein n=1 Tax=Pedobacter immunditicola TaxID=3133440 RepID=UPI00309E6217
MIAGLVSVITPMYNGERFVEQTINSVIGQTYTSWEMIIIDDGSKDNGHALVTRYAAQDSRITVHSQVNTGSAGARNKGIRCAKGQYIALLDADDTWNPEFLEKQLKLMKEKNAELVYASHTRIDAAGKECLRPFLASEKEDYYSMLKTCSISCLTGLYDTKTFGKIYLREDLKSNRDDYVYWLDILKKVKVAYGNREILANYRMLNTSATANKSKVIIPQFMVLYKVENLGLLKSVYYLTNWAFYGFLKYKE